MIKPSAGIFYTGIDNLREKASKACLETDFEIPVIIDCSKVSGLDFTSISGLESLASDLNKHNQTLVLQGLEPKLQVKLNHANMKFCDEAEEVNEVLEEVPKIGLHFLQHRSSVPFPSKHRK